ncbi:MAG TPA: hypothetical protein VGI86_21735 [Acidimicrobiia bacterium]
MTEQQTTPTVEDLERELARLLVEHDDATGKARERLAQQVDETEARIVAVRADAERDERRAALAASERERQRVIADATEREKKRLQSHATFTTATQTRIDLCPQIEKAMAELVAMLNDYAIQCELQFEAGKALYGRERVQALRNSRPMERWLGHQLWTVYPRSPDFHLQSKFHEKTLVDIDAFAHGRMAYERSDEAIAAGVNLWPEGTKQEGTDEQYVTVDGVRYLSCNGGRGLVDAELLEGDEDDTPASSGDHEVPDDPDAWMNDPALHEEDDDE